MAKTTRALRNVAAAPRARPAPRLGPGLHAAVIEIAGEGAYRVRTIAGDLVPATPAASVAPALLDECLRTRRTVLVAEEGGGAVILGALQTAPSARADPDGGLAIEARSVEIAAADRIALKVGASSLSLDREGVVRLNGDRLTIDVGALVQILSANVNLP